MMNKSVVLFALFLFLSCESDVVQRSMFNVQYQSPVDYDIVLAGNFGEPRPWHFHGGIDVKTDNQEGKQIFSIADGYVSRITVNKYGFGNAIYVNHPDGLTSVYCHLKRFADKYEQLFERTGWRDTLDFRYAADQLPVKGGDLIALSGNTGHSTGPHLHLELHDTKTWVMIDPMEKLAPFIADTVAPQAHSFMAVPVVGEGLFNGGATKQTFGFGQPDTKVQHSTFTVQRRFTAWGRVGFALWADDYSEATYNHYGVRHVQLLVDGREVFSADVSGIPISCQPEVNQWGDYDHWRHTRIWYMKSYKEPGMRLPILHTDFSDGIVTFDEERPYHLTYLLRDYQGNTSRYDFTVTGQRDARIRKPQRRCQLLNPYLLYEQVLWPLHERRR
jgi:murein DD-endopeptidase MepM/ murein hydrolase activator NlpD